MRRQYVNSLGLTRSIIHYNLMYTMRLKLGYRITAQLSTYFNTQLDAWEVIHNESGRALVATRTRTNAVIAAYAFADADINTINVVKCGVVEYTNREAKDRMKNTAVELVYNGIAIIVDRNV